MDAQIPPYALVGGGLVVGGAVGYLVAKKALEKRYQALANEEIESVKEVYARRNKTEGYATPGDVLKTQEKLEKLGYVSEVPAEELGKAFVKKVLKRTETEDAVVEETVTVETNVFKAPENDPTIPYLIDADIFMLNQNEWQQHTLTYYEEDNVLVDDQDIPLDDVNALVGKDNLTAFGEVDGLDKNVVYIRNEVNEVDFEIVHVPGSYQQIVLGETPIENRRVGKNNDGRND